MRSGFALAAVATGAVDMPSKEPSPFFGTAAQPGPNSPLVNDLRGLVSQLDDAARSIRVLADYLERHPEALVRGKQGGYQ